MIFNSKGTLFYEDSFTQKSDCDRLSKSLGLSIVIFMVIHAAAWHSQVVNILYESIKLLK
jgi:hypothetical protein